MARNEPALVYVYRKTRNDPRPTLVTRFLTRYAAQRFVLHRLRTDPKRSEVQWFIETGPKHFAAAEIRRADR